MLYKFGILFLGLAEVFGSGIYRVPLYREPGVTGIQTRMGSKVKLKNHRNLMYNTNITMGTPPQQFLAEFDTGSSDMWVLSKQCTSESCTWHPRYDSFISSSHISDGERVTIHYGKGAITGSLSSDLISVADLKTPQTFVEVTNILEEFSDDMRFHANIGMAFQSIAESKAPSLFDNLVTSQCIDPVFSFYFNRKSDSYHGGVLLLGGYNGTYYLGNLHYIPLVKPTEFWAVILEDVHLGYRSIKKPRRFQNWTAIFDTGSSVIHGPEEAVWDLYTSLGAQPSIDDDNVQTVGCDTADTLPRLIFTMDGIEYHVPPSDYISKFKEDFETVVCYVDIFPMNEQFWILGQTFLGRYYSVYDVGTKMIGLADAVYPYIG